MDVHDRIEMLREEIAALTAIIKAEGFVSTGSQGQPVAHPAVTQRHAAIALLHKLEAKLPDVPDVDPLDEFLSARD